MDENTGCKADTGKRIPGERDEQTATHHKPNCMCSPSMSEPDVEGYYFAYRSAAMIRIRKDTAK